MIKLGIYGLLRASFVWLAPALPWWGATLLLVGAVSAVAGVLYAIVDRDLKRLLAFSSIENVGIVLVGTGAALTFAATSMAGLALLALAAALYHVVNHAAFKSLLFMAAGGVLHGTGTRDMEALGGLIKRQPWTAACFLVGAVAIAGLPPLNGFVSEWLMFQALLQNVLLPQPSLNLVFALAIAGLALAAGLAVACFVKAFGITFLALPRSDAAAAAHEAPVTMRVAMVATAVACAALALGASSIVPALAVVAATLVPAPPPVTLGAWLTLEVSGEFASLSMPAVALALAGGILLPVLLLAVARVRPRPRRYETWACGRVLQTARMEYTATAFADPFTRVFDFFYRPVKRLDIDRHPESRFFVRRIRYENPTRFIVDAWAAPVLTSRPPLAFAGIILLMSLFLLGTFFLALAGLDAGSAFGGMGSSREVAVAALAEPTVILAVFALALRANTTNLGGIVERVSAEPLPAVNPAHLLAFAAFFIVMLAETGRLPVDNPATHLELTMIHEAMVLEYSGRHLALVEWASAMTLLLFLTLLANLFFPWGVPADVEPPAMLLGLLALAGKLVLLAVALAALETAIAKLRLFRVPELLSGSFALAVLSVSAVFLLRCWRPTRLT